MFYRVLVFPDYLPICFVAYRIVPEMQMIVDAHDGPKPMQCLRSLSHFREDISWSDRCLRDN